MKNINKEKMIIIIVAVIAVIAVAILAAVTIHNVKLAYTPMLI